MVINLSFIISTKNRLSFLKITLEKLIPTLQDDEEIIVVDGKSSDGSKEYLEKLYSEKKIHYFISEPDKNQANGWNKAMLMANGEIIKKVIDDDIICLNAIRICKDYMLKNLNVDVCISNDMSVKLGENVDKISFHSRIKQFQNWKVGKIKSFTSGDVHMLIRRTSLAYIGLYDASFTMIDWEYSLRMSYLRANIAYYTGYNALSISHEASISSNTNQKRLKHESKRACPMYEYAGDAAQISFWSKIKIFIGRNILSKFKMSKSVEKKTIFSNQEFINFYLNYQKFLDNYNSNNFGHFVFYKTK